MIVILKLLTIVLCLVYNWSSDIYVWGIDFFLYKLYKGTRALDRLEIIGYFVLYTKNIAMVSVLGIVRYI